MQARSWAGVAIALSIVRCGALGPGDRERELGMDED